MNPEVFLARSIGEYEVWQYMNESLPQNATILTHENRHYYLRDDLRLLHLDDYRLIPLYGMEAEVIHAKLKELGIGYYLRIANEKNHPILKQLGVDGLMEKHMQLIYAKGETRLYKIVYQ
jgi:hypothetical protein